MATRVLGMGDVVGLMQDFESVVDTQEAEADALRMMSGQFSLDDFLKQVKTIQKMGSLKDLVEKMPGVGGMLPPGMDLDDKELVRIEAMIQSMSRPERDDPHVLIREPSRVTRIAKGSGQPGQGVTELVQKFLFMQQMMSQFGGLGPMGGLLGKVPGMQQFATARNLRRAMKQGGMPGMGMPGMGMPGLGLPGMFGMPASSAPSAPRMRTLSRQEKNARKGQRKRERAARKKGKGGK
jgi:signal recognition particle subunit SRP54